ncbi:hypothetical protein [Streptomyces termitum]|uniref:hypothetical protein n=1 Tax=Streptomyces termitum TaxID=67368 RepID=UPI0033B2A91E
MRSEKPSRPASSTPLTLMTLRVSRDSGRTWGPTVTLTDETPLAPLMNPNQYPPCACPRCREADTP